MRIKSSFKVFRQYPSDDIILKTSYDGKDHYIVSGDQHLLSLKEFKGKKIIKISEIFDLLKS